MIVVRWPVWAVCAVLCVLWGVGLYGSLGAGLLLAVVGVGPSAVYAVVRRDRLVFRSS